MFKNVSFSHYIVVPESLFKVIIQPSEFDIYAMVRKEFQVKLPTSMCVLKIMAKLYIFRLCNKIVFDIQIQLTKLNSISYKKKLVRDIRI